MSEVVLLTSLVSFIWYLNDKGVPLPKTGFTSMMSNVFLILLGLVGPVLIGIFVGFLIDDQMKK